MQSITINLKNKSEACFIGIHCVELSGSDSNNTVDVCLPRSNKSIYVETFVSCC